jgi:hypothetical protein
LSCRIFVTWSGTKTVTSDWGSVRKIRSVTEIRLLVDSVASQSEGVTTEELRSRFQALRLGRQKERFRLTTYYNPALLVAPAAKALDYLVRDLVSFAVVTGIFRKSNQRYVAGPRTAQLKTVLNAKREKKIRGILQFLTQSPYKAYHGFLRALAGHQGEINVPPSLATRRDLPGVKEYMKTMGFLTDVASFFALRDLYYDMALLNWFRDENRKQEHFYITNEIWLVNDLLRINPSKDLENIAPKVSPELFWETLLDEYNRAGPVGHYANLIQIRDSVCYRLRMSDANFAALLASIEKITSREGYSVALASTPLVSRLPMGYIVKIGALPRIQGSDPATRIRIALAEVA